MRSTSAPSGRRPIKPSRFGSLSILLAISRYNDFRGRPDGLRPPEGPDGLHRLCRL